MDYRLSALLLHITSPVGKFWDTSFFFVGIVLASAGLPRFPAYVKVVVHASLFWFAGSKLLRNSQSYH